MVNLWECDIYLFSDSVLKLGKKKSGNAQEKWIAKYEEELKWLPKDSDLRLKTIHGQSFRYHWNVEAGATTADMLKKIKKLVDEKAGGDPSKFQDRVILFGCLNDLNDLPKYQDGCADPLLTARKAAEATRDYISKFRTGHFVWMGPGSEKVWQYDQRTPPLTWQPRADAFMNIIEEAGHPIFTGGVSLGKGKLLDEGQNEHFAADWDNVKMLIQFIYDSNALASFLALWEILPSKPKLPAKASPSAGGDPVRRKVIIKAGVTPCTSLPKQQQRPPNLERGLRVTAATSRPRRPSLSMIGREGAQREEVQRRAHARPIEASASTRRPSQLASIIYSTPRLKTSWLQAPD